MTKKRVLLIAANDMGNSGVPSVYMQIVRNLSDKYIFDIVITRENYFYKDEFLSYGGNIFLIKEKTYKSLSKRLWWRFFEMPKRIKEEMSNILLSNKYDIVHSFKETESCYYLQVAKKYNVNKRIVHNNRQFEMPNNILARQYIKYCLKKTLKYSTDNITISSPCGKTFFGKKSFSVIFDTYDENKYKFGRCLLKSEQLHLLQVGTFLPLKNQLFTLDVIKKISFQYPNVVISFIGKVFDKDYYNLFLQRIRALQLEKNVNIYEHNIDQLPILSTTTFTLVPSFKEGLSLTAIESQACGIKVFASNGVPLEVNCGNVIFLELNSDNWASEILKTFESVHNERTKVDMSKFSQTTFTSKIKTIYNS